MTPQYSPSLRLRDLATDYAADRAALHIWQPKTARTERSRLFRLFTVAGVTRIDELGDIPADWRQLMADLTPYTQANRRASFRGFVTWLFDTGVIPTDERLLDIPTSSARHRSRLDNARIDVELVLSTASPREALVVALMGYCGLRRVEVARLTWACVDLRRRKFIVRGKAGRERVLDLSDAYDHVARARGPFARPDGFVVASERRWPQGLNETKIWLEARRALDRAGVSAPPKALRAEAVARLAESGASVEQLRAFLGHDDPSAIDDYLPRFVTDPVRTVNRQPGSGDRPRPENASPARWAFRWALSPSACAGPVTGELASLSELVEWYLERRRSDWLPVTYASQALMLRQLAASADLLTYDSVRAWLTQGECARNTVRVRTISVRCFIRELLAAGLIVADPTKALKTPRLVANAPRRLSDDDCAVLLKANRGPTVTLILLLMLCHALTATQMHRLGIGDVDVDHLVLKHPETGLIPLSVEVALAVRRHLAAGDRTNGPLFVGASGQRMSRQRITGTVLSAFKRAELSGSAKTLQATAIAHFVESGAPVHAIRDAAGHKALSTTFRHLQVGQEAGSREFAPRAWPIPSSPDSQYFTLREAALALGISIGWLATVRRQANVVGSRTPTGNVVFTTSDIHTLRGYLNAHRRGNPRHVPARIAEQIVRLHDDDDRPFAWISRHLNAARAATGEAAVWTPYRIAVAYRGGKAPWTSNDLSPSTSTSGSRSTRSKAQPPPQRQRRCDTSPSTSPSQTQTTSPSTRSAHGSATHRGRP